MIMIAVGDRRDGWVGPSSGLLRFRPPQVGKRKLQREAKCALLRVLAVVLLQECLTPPTLLEMAIMRWSAVKEPTE